jgi:hypothetical protein
MHPIPITLAGLSFELGLGRDLSADAGTIVRSCTTALENVCALSAVFISRSDSVPYRVELPRELFLPLARLPQLVERLTYELLLRGRCLRDPLQALISGDNDLARPLEALPVFLTERTKSGRCPLIDSGPTKTDLVDELRQKLDQAVG